MLKVVSQSLFCLLILLVQGVGLRAQVHNYTQYTIEDGLPTNYVYGLVEDDRGYIWAYTEQGIARFDGYEWKSYGLKDGLGTLDCYSMCPLVDGSFLVGGRGWPTVVKGDSLFKLPALRNVSGLYLENPLLTEGYPPILSFTKPPGGGREFSVVIHSADSFNIYSGVTRALFRGAQSRVFNSEEQKMIIVKEVGREDLLFNPSLIFTGELGNDKFAFWSSPYHYFLNDKVIGESDGKQRTFFKGLVQGLLLQVYTDSTLFVFDSTYANITESIDMSSWYEDFDVNRVFRAKNGDLWIATRSTGVLHVRSESQKVRLLSRGDGGGVSIEGVTAIEDGVFVADDKSNAFLLKGNHLRSLDLARTIQNDSRFQYLREIREGELVLVRNKNVLSITNENVKLTKIIDGQTLGDINQKMLESLQLEKGNVLANAPLVGLRGLLFRKDFVWIEDPAYLVKLNGDGLRHTVLSSSSCVYDKRLLINENELYAGRASDLLRITASTFDTIWTSDSISISALYTISDSTFLLGSHSRGIFRLTLSDGVQLERLFSSKLVRTITRDPSGTFWAATYSGVYRFSESGEVDIHLTQSNGLPSSETYDLDFFSDSVALGTAMGLAIFSQDYIAEIGSKIPARLVRLNNVRVNGEDLENDGINIDLSPGEDDLEIDFSLLHPGSNGDILYDVQLLPYDQEPIRQTSRTVRYSQLEAGRYSFKVNATAIDGSVYALEHPLEIRVRAHFYKQARFQLLCLFLVCGAAWLFFHLREKSKYRAATERLNNKRRISELQLESLRSQMNPHFVFNALGSIQYYIQSEEKDLADSYLTKFAQLMRKYLDSSKRNLVTVGEEVALLTQYMELEKMRFDHTFTFTFLIDDKVDDSDPLPSMILQPFVENAIIHGLANRSAPGGEIEISIIDDNNTTIVVITDNGIGIDNSNKMKRRGHRSRATEITNERITALQNSGNAEIELSYDVPYPNDLNCPGSKVTLRINFQPDEI